MIIQLARDVRIQVEDGRSFDVQTLKRSKKTGAETWKVWGYYGTLEGAANAALQAGLFRPKATVRVGKLINAMRRARERIKDACLISLNVADLARLDGVSGDDAPDDLFDFPEDA